MGWFFVLILSLSDPGEVKGPYPTVEACREAAAEAVTYTEPVPQDSGPGEASFCYFRP